jgi:hypothetical protein
MKSQKRIQKITVQRIDDNEGPDTSYPSYLGEYASKPTSEFSIDRDHAEDCPRFWANDDIPDDARVCDCTTHDQNTYRYFNPGSVEPFDPAASWIPADVTDKHAHWLAAMRENASDDYARMEAYNREEWHFIGIQAQAEIVLDGTCQTIKSGGLWGIESDSDESYLCHVEREELTSLRGILHTMGFSKRAIAAACKGTK